MIFKNLHLFSEMYILTYIRPYIFRDLPDDIATEISEDRALISYEHLMLSFQSNYMNTINSNVDVDNADFVVLNGFEHYFQDCGVSIVDHELLHTLNFKRSNTLSKQKKNRIKNKFKGNHI